MSEGFDSTDKARICGVCHQETLEAQDCDYCDGTGVLGVQPCPHCDSTGVSEYFCHNCVEFTEPEEDEGS